MKKAIFKGILLGLIFAAALMLISAIMNQGNTDMTTEMGEASYPIVSMSTEGHRVNSLHGYSMSMDSAYLRDTVQPVGSDRKLEVHLDTYGRSISQIAFEVRSLNGNRLVESTAVEVYEQDDEAIDFTITLKDLIEYDTEYMLVFLITPEEAEPIRYYTRIVLSDMLYIREKLDYIVDFHERTFDKEAAAELTKYLESNSEGDNTTFHKVTIHSSFNQITWGDLTVNRVTEPDILIKDLTEQTGAFRMEYLASVRDGRNTNHYRISEYYRIRYTPERMYLLDYERTMDQIFDEEGNACINDKIVLGIAGDDVKLVESDGGNIFAFSAADKLYSYNVTDNKLIRLFSFYGNIEGLSDARNVYDRHDLQILTVDETGNVMFVVYGYMNRGRHEGNVGVVVYYYSSMTNTTEELLYIPYDKSYELLKTDIERLSYVNRLGIYYFILEGNVYAVNLQKHTCQVLVSGLREDGYHVSDSNKMLVWQEGDDLYSSNSLTLMNLNTQKQTQIRAGVNEYISVLGFMEEDLIYGLTKKGDIAVNSAGITTFPMYCVRIQSDDGSVLKTYHKNDVYVVDSAIEENQITLSRVVWNEESESYEPTVDDQIMSTEQIKEGSNTIGYVVTENYETICQIAVKNEIDSKGLQYLSPKEVLFEGDRTIAVADTETEEARYYVYAKNGIEGIYVNSGKAVDLAYRLSGVVVDDDGEYVWRRVTRSTRNQIMAITEDEATETRSSLAVCLDTILKFEGTSRNTERLLNRGDTVFSILKSDLQECTILDLSGCSLDAVLYYVNQDIPVLAMLDDGNAVLIVGFNELNIVVMDPVTGTLYKKGMNDSTEWLKENGNRFITYMRKGE
ncbi:MAG: hypothetical protein K2L82_10650 [Lachnospiraceae bacterium]|nr:hypothetical protein [Lachnospiraceae bacterium]